MHARSALTVAGLALALALAGALPAAAQDTFEPNDTIEQAAGPLGSGVDVDSYIFSPTDVDWFYFDADEGTVEILLTNIPAGQDYDLFVTDENGIILFISDNAGSADEFLLLEVTGGAARGWIVIEGFDGSFSQLSPYRLRATFNETQVNTPPGVTVNTPNGGETLTAGAQTSISYTAFDLEDGASLSIDLEYSLNGGGSWLPIASGRTNTGSFNWLVPDVTTSSGLVRVTATDSGLLSGNDTSNTVFTIQPAVQNTAPSVAVLAPNGGESLVGGQQKVIAFTANDAQDGTALSMSFEYSTDDGSSWVAIAGGQANTGSFSWTVPEVNTGTARVRVTALDSGGLSASDTSDAPFGIQPSTPLGSATVSLASGVGVTAGQSVTVPVSLTNDQAAAGVQLTVSFNASQLTPTGVVAGPRAGAMTLGSNLSTPGEVILTLTSETGQTIAAGSGTVAEITFSTPVTADGTQTLSLSNVIVSDVLARAMTLTTVGGSVIITGGTSPDLSLSLPGGLTAAPGTVLDVPVDFDNNVAVAALQFVLGFDGGVLAPISVTQGTRTSPMTIESNLARAGEVRVVFHFPSGGTLAAGTGTACTVRFQVLGSASSNTTLAFSEVVASDSDGNSLPVGTSSELLTSVRALHLEAEARDQGIRLFWSAERDAGHLGYRVLRSRGDDPLPIHEQLLGPESLAYLDRDVESGVRYRYWLEAVDRSGAIQRFGPVSAMLPRVGLWAGVPYPNPSRGEMRVDVRSDGHEVEAFIVDAAGRRVRRLDSPGGSGGTVQWDGRLESGEPAPAGIYFAVIRGGAVELTRRVVRVGP